MSNITSGNSSGGDVYARCKTGSNTAGRGSEAGWTPCPLCTNNNLLLSSVMNDGGGISSIGDSSCSGGSLLNISVGKFLRCPLLCIVDCGVHSLSGVLCTSCVLFFAISIFYWFSD